MSQNESLLVINAGSSSLKFQVFNVHENRPELAWRGLISCIGLPTAHFRVCDHTGAVVLDRALVPSEARDLSAAQTVLADWLRDTLPKSPFAVGHRIVHGGPDYATAVLVDDQVLDTLDGLVLLAPLHQRNNLAPVHVLRERRPDIPQVACFDTAFHRSHSPLVDRFALPARFLEKGVRRYGFHGLSYHYISTYMQEHLPEVVKGRVVVAHLGSGASACAMVNGVGVETTMGFTALDGLPMSTRPGTLDPGVVLWMLEQGMSHDEIQRVLYTESGLKGLSGISGDVRDLLASSEPAAKMALDYFTYRSAMAIAGLCVSVKGLDTLVFTAGIGENSPEIRAGICGHLAWLGIDLDPELNQANADCITRPGSRIAVRVIATNEELVIARQTLACLEQAQIMVAD
ncbi:MAG: acetate/propionate family kinase [Alcaligenaceae bacterium]|nr:acetate/propionate family kinase [Alcaligenaceae bacterium]